MARRSPRLVALALAVVVVATVTAGCSTIDELLQLTDRIERAGYEVGDVFHDDFGTSRNEVQVEASEGRGQPPPDGQEEIAGIVWETYPRRFDTVAVTLDDDLVVFTRGDLQERFGPRAERLDEREFRDELSSSVGRAAIAVVVFLILLIVGVVVVVVLVRRRRRNRPPPAPPSPPAFGGGGWMPPPPAAPPPGYSPPPGPSGYPPPSPPPG